MTLAISSKDCMPKLCKEILQLHDILDLFDPKLIIIGPCPSKVPHIKSFMATGFKPENTFFFDDNFRNVSEVQKLGVHCVRVTQKQGTTLDAVKLALNSVKSKQHE